MPHLMLRADVHAAFVQEDLVLLDVATDRYVCLAGAGLSARLSGDRAHLETDDLELSRRLREEGLMQDSRAPVAPRTPLPLKAERSGLLPEIPPMALRDLAPASGALLDLMLHYRRRAFAGIVNAGLRPRMEPPRLTASLQAAVVRFHAWAPYVAAVVECYLALTAGRAVRSARDCRKVER